MLHLTLALSLATADVIDVGPTRAFTDVQTAIHAAQSGDVIRIDDGTYGYFGVFNKSLRIVARNDGGSVLIDGSVRIQEIAADQEVLIDGLEVVGAEMTTQPTLVIANTFGPVRIQDCTVRGSTGHTPVHTQNRLALRALNVADLTIHSSTLTGGLDTRSHHIGQDAVVLDGVTATIWDSTIEGTDCWVSAFGARGGEGIQASDSDLYLQGCIVRSGNGGDADTNGCGANGCPGTCIASHSTVLRLRDIQYDPGHAGWNASLCDNGCLTFAPGETLVESGLGMTTHYPGDSVDFDLGHAIQSSGDAFNIQVDGPAGSNVLLIVGPATGRLVPTFPGYVGDVHVVGPLGAPRRLFLGAAPATLATTLPDFGRLAVTQWYIQPALVGNGEIIMGPARGVTILGSGW